MSAGGTCGMPTAACRLQGLDTAQLGCSAQLAASRTEQQELSQYKPLLRCEDAHCGEQTYTKRCCCCHIWLPGQEVASSRLRCFALLLEKQAEQLWSTTTACTKGRWVGQNKRT